MSWSNGGKMNLREMKVRKQWEEENKSAAERYQLSMARVAEIVKETVIAEPFGEYFKSVGGFILQIKNLIEEIETNTWEKKSIEELEKINLELYQDIIGEAYDYSFANPAYAAAKLGEEYGQLFSFVYTEIRAIIADAFEGKLLYVTICTELFLELYTMFETEIPSYNSIKDVVYWFISDYTDIFYTKSLEEQLKPENSFAVELIEKSDLTDLRYLYQYGERITDCEKKTAEFLNQLSEEKIIKIAKTFVEGYVRGFFLANKPLEQKEVVCIRYPIGFERVVKKAITLFQEKGLETSIYRYALHSVNKRRNIRIGFSGTVVNKQYEYDHRFDDALYFDKAFYERKLSVLKVTYEKNEKLAKKYAGPAVIEKFGEEPFVPVTKPEACKLSEKQQKLSIEYAGEAGLIANKYISGEETSFTIIAFPTPEIGENFEEIFEETVKINTLDNQAYEQVQQNMIDVLDRSDYVMIKGMNGNHTDLKVKFISLGDEQKETKFENCVADVNIPVGEVFTSPELKGTQGVLHVKEAFLQDLNYKNLEIVFQDGCIVDYNCSNFVSEEKNKTYFKENIMQNRETLPLGEFAIGTNTAAYVMARKYGILEKLPVLIVEKMGPHFAVGDTCYSHSEEMRVYNPDGKEIVAKENDFSRRRKTEPEKAYFNCHTDITIPYDEIGEIACYDREGNKTVLIENGRFILGGTEMLNQAFL